MWRSWPKGASAPAVSRGRSQALATIRQNKWWGQKAHSDVIHLFDRQTRALFVVCIGVVQKFGFKAAWWNWRVNQKCVFVLLPALLVMISSYVSGYRNGCNPWGIVSCSYTMGLLCVWLPFHE